MGFEAWDWYIEKVWFFPSVTLAFVASFVAVEVNSKLMLVVYSLISPCIQNPAPYTPFRRGIDGRMTKLEALLEREQWTKAAPPAWSVPLRMHWHEPRFRPAWLKLPPHVTEELTSATEHDAYVANTLSFTAEIGILPPCVNLMLLRQRRLTRPLHSQGRDFSGHSC